MTSDNYADKKDDDVHGIDNNLSITEEQEYDDSFLDDGVVEIEDL